MTFMADIGLVISLSLYSYKILKRQPTDAIHIKINMKIFFVTIMTWKFIYLINCKVFFS